MWRRPVIAVVTLALLLGFGRQSEPLSAEQLPSATEIKIFVPFDPRGMLNPNLQVSGRVTVPQCQSGAITTTRPDAWRCVTADPCFVPQFAGNQMELACANTPWSGDVTLLTIEMPLRSQEECMAGPPLCRQQLDLDRAPWALELANGARCTLFTGTITSLAGVGQTYGCSNPMGTAGGVTQAVVDRTTPLWRVFFLPEGDYVMADVAVLVAWY
jgi:hypothetical protein